MKLATIQTMVMAVLIAFVSSFIVYFCYTTNYTRHSFSPQTFKEQYSSGVYKYRILGPYLLTRLDSVLGNGIPSDTAEKRLSLQDVHASERFYYAYYYLNTFFLILMSMVLTLLVSMDIGLHIPIAEKNLLLFMVILLANFTQFVVCPYDISAYFFQLLTILIFLACVDKHYLLSLTTICLLLVLSTLNRESTALTVAFLVIVMFFKWGPTKKSLFSMFLLIFCFLGTYFGLRYYIKTPDPHKTTTDYLKYNLFLQGNQVGILFWALFFYLSLAIANSKENKLLIVLYHIVSLPYIWTCFTVGMLAEVRLYMPLFLGSLLLGKLDVVGFRILPTRLLHLAGIR